MDGTQQLAALAQVLNVLEGDGIESWLFGGWAVDFHVGAVTRAHADLDLAVWAVDAERIAALLERDGWSYAPEAGEDGYTGYARDVVRLELAFLVRRADRRVCTPLRDGFASRARGRPSPVDRRQGAARGEVRAARRPSGRRGRTVRISQSSRRLTSVAPETRFRRGRTAGHSMGRAERAHGGRPGTWQGQPLLGARAAARGRALDLSDCEVDSTVIGLMIGKARARRGEGSYLELLVEPASQVERALESLGVDELVTLHEHMPSDDLA